MRRVYLAVLLILPFAVEVFAQGTSTAEVVFRKNIKQHIARGEDTTKLDAAVVIGADSIRVTRNAKDETVIPYTSISSITYETRASVRAWAPTWGRRQDHFLIIEFATRTAGEFVELGMGKDVAPRLLALLESRSGMQVGRIAR